MLSSPRGGPGRARWWFDLFRFPSQEPVLHHHCATQGNGTWQPEVSAALIQKLKKTKRQPSLLSSWSPLADCGIPLFLRSSGWSGRRSEIYPIAATLFLECFDQEGLSSINALFAVLVAEILGSPSPRYDIKNPGYSESRL